MTVYKYGDEVLVDGVLPVHFYVGSNPFDAGFSVVVSCRAPLGAICVANSRLSLRERAPDKPDFKVGDKLTHAKLGACTYTGHLMWSGDQCIVSLGEGKYNRVVCTKDLSPAPAKPEPTKPEPKFKLGDRVAIHRHDGVNNGVVEVIHHLAGNVFEYSVHRDGDRVRTRCSEWTICPIPSSERAKAVAGGLQEHSVGGNYPYIPVAFVTGDKISWRLMNAQTGKYAGYKHDHNNKWFPYTYVTVHGALRLADQRTHPSTAIVWGE